MYILDKEIRNDSWELLHEVGTGELFIIQNTSSTPVFYVDLNYYPDGNIRGFILPPQGVLRFKRTDVDLYVRKSNDIGHLTIGIGVE